MPTCKRLLPLLILLLTGTACAGGTTPLAEAEPMRSYVWYDGDTPRQAWLDPEVVAIFGDRNDSVDAAVRSLAPAARQLPSATPGLRLWRLPQAVRAARSLQTLEPDARISPVLRDSPSPDGPMRALPGGVIVHLDPAWSSEEAESWLLSRNLQPAREILPNAFLVPSEPGLAALELANRLRQEQGVVAAMPDWWQELAPR
ncbi:MAG: hypothetical protein GX093_12295 [Xanthomonadaceae bacterium]|nr:hypothetical protein [Xanthomonadaceae bacterium]